MNTISSAIVRFIYVLSTHQDVQNKLLPRNGASKEYFMETLSMTDYLLLPYLYAICRETLRL